MGDQSAPPLDSQALIQTLDRHEVNYVIVGGFAGVAHGATRVTFDIDIVPQTEQENLARLASALKELKAELRIDSSESIPTPIDAISLAGMELSTWRTNAGDIDVIRGIPKSSMKDLANYEDLTANCTQIELFGATVQIGSLDDVIRSKITTNRPADRQALPELQKLLNRTRRLGRGGDGLGL